MTDKKGDILWRVYLVYVIFLVFAVIILFRVGYIQFVQGDIWRQKAKEATLRYINIEAIRGDICSDDGSLMATSVPIFEVRCDVSKKTISDEIFNKNIDSLAFCLAQLFPESSKATYKEQLIKARRKNSRYFLIKRNVTYTQLKKIKKFPIFKLGRYKGGLIVEQKTRREKPFRYLAERTIGFERKDNYYVGIEGAYSSVLGGQSGKRLMQKIADDVWMPLNDEDEIEPKNGSDIITTIDVNIQDVAEHSLMNHLQKHDATHGCVILMEVKTGYIKAIANLTRTSPGIYEEKYNYAIGESSEPGSTFKLASMIVALDDGVVKISDRVNTYGGKIKYADREMSDSHEGGYGVITVKEAFSVSSNVAISKIIYDHYKNNPSKFTDKLYKMGLHRPLDISLPGEGMPQIKNPKNKSWSRVSLPWMAIGYEVAITPLQTLTLYNAIANNGKMVKPQFVSEIRHTGKTIQQFQPEILNSQICKPSTVKAMREMLEEVVENGTAKNIKNPIYKIAGKTGTAQVAMANLGYKSSSKISYKASFAGYFPAENPKYSCIVIINNPNTGTYYGSTVAAPVFKEVADKVYANELDIHSNLLATSNNLLYPWMKVGFKEDIEHIYKYFGMKIVDKAGENNIINPKINNKQLICEAYSYKTDIIPDVTGMNLSDALYVLENLGLNVKFTGKGKVLNQSIASGTTVNNNSTIYLQLGVNNN